jgi:hypothetical protein
MALAETTQPISEEDQSEYSESATPSRASGLKKKTVRKIKVHAI